MIRLLNEVPPYPNKRPRLEAHPDAVEGLFKNLPLELVEKIIGENSITTQSYFNPGYSISSITTQSYFYTISSVSKVFYQAAANLLIQAHNNTPSWHDSSCLARFTTHFSINFLTKYSNEITYFSTKLLQHLSVPTIVSLIEKLPNLKELKINTPGISANSLAKNFKNLKALFLENGNMSYEELRDLSKKFPNIRTFHIGTVYMRGCTFFDAIVKYFPNLETISVNPLPLEAAEDDDLEPEVYHQHCFNWISEQENVMPKIKEFAVGGSWFTDASIPFILQSFPNLEHLSLASNCSITFEVIPENLPKSDTLKELDLLGCGVMGKGLKNIANLFPCLEKVDLSGSNFKDSSAEEIISFLKKPPYLKHLELDKKHRNKELERHLPSLKISYR